MVAFCSFAGNSKTNPPVRVSFLMESTGTVSLTPDFFVKELQAYSDWGTAFWRELFQNSVDAGAGKIAITIREASGLATVTFADDGPGMSLDVLKNIYFRLGATTKGGLDIGGFGRARIVTCFAHSSYAIESANYRAEGCGADYRIIEGMGGRRGCLVEVSVGTRSAEWLQSKLEAYLARCQLCQDVSINGAEFRRWTYRYRKAGMLSFGDVHVNRSQQEREVLVRVNGVLMFARYTAMKARVIVEVDPARSREVLTSNRDGLQSGAQNDFDQFIDKLAADCESSLSERFSPFRTDYGSPVRSIVSRRGQESNATTAAATCAEDGAFRIAAHCHTAPFNDIPTVSAGAQSGLFFENSRLDYVLYVESGKPGVRRNSESFSPEKIAGTRRERLLLGWNRACEIALNILLDVRQYASIDYSTGFIFSDSRRAACMSDRCGHALLLNPLDVKSARNRYRIGSAETVSALLAIAAHEVAHIAEEYHNETYAAVLTDLVAHLDAKHYREVRLALRKKPVHPSAPEMPHP